MTANVPLNAWYAVAAAREVGRTPLARRLAGERIVAYRDSHGDAVVLVDRCAHRPVALSEGRVEGDDLIAPYTGWRYGPDGRCVSVPTQPNVPVGAGVRSYPVHEDGSFVWVWAGEPGAAKLRRPPSTDWLRSEGWAHLGNSWETKASLRMLQDNFADITHVAQVDADIAPPALLGSDVPPLDVKVTETSVSFRRSYPATAVAPWQAQVMGLDESGSYPQVEEGEFVSPGLWVDRWTVNADVAKTFVFTHALTPLDDSTTGHIWTVSRNFALGAAAEGTLRPIFERYYQTVRDILEGMQGLVDSDGPREEIHLAADAALTQVRRIMDRLVADEAR
ncbi:MAG TPA: Rieske 2Fe-2S domain-containing protein [Marmoricola sp.]|nr:Rieske 2Fe-2S domain-containing protein [Marmoricola sp.]